MRRRAVVLIGLSLPSCLLSVGDVNDNPDPMTNTGGGSGTDAALGGSAGAAGLLDDGGSADSSTAGLGGQIPEGGSDAGAGGMAGGPDLDSGADGALDADAGGDCAGRGTGYCQTVSKDYCADFDESAPLASLFDFLREDGGVLGHETGGGCNGSGNLRTQITNTAPCKYADVRWIVKQPYTTVEMGVDWKIGAGQVSIERPASIVTDVGTANACELFLMFEPGKLTLHVQGPGNAFNDFYPASYTPNYGSWQELRMRVDAVENKATVRLAMNGKAVLGPLALSKCGAGTNVEGRVGHHCHPIPGSMRFDNLWLDLN